MPEQEKRFEEKLNPELRHQVCVLHAMCFPISEVRKWLEGQGIRISHQGLRKLVKRKRWCKVVRTIRGEILNQSAASKWLKSLISEMLVSITAEFKELALQTKAEFKKAEKFDAMRAGDIHEMGCRMVESFDVRLQFSWA